MSKPKHKVIFAAGGTGGHLFPAQALAQELLATQDIELLFAGANLSRTAYFDKETFGFCDIVSTTPFRGNIFQAIKSIGVLCQGIRQSLQLLAQEKPDLVIGFGSFHSFPILCAAKLKKIPLILFESNAIPGKVVRLFSKKAVLTALYFPDAKAHLKGTTIEVDIPTQRALSYRQIPKEEARRQLQLDPRLPTLLVFGGSQGAKAINEHILQLLPLLKSAFQLIHLTGNEETASQVSTLCQTLGIKCYVKKFEPQMQIAWSAADVAICRSGALTLSELLYHEVPALLIPYPYASDQHQLKNAQFLEKVVGGARCFVESTLSTHTLLEALTPLLLPNSAEREQETQAIRAFKAEQKKAHLASVIIEYLET